MTVPSEKKAPLSPFFRMIERLLETGELVLFGRVDQPTEEEEQSVVAFLKSRYDYEALGYPHFAPPFDEAAALWSSKILFHAAQLVMYRQHEAESLKDYIPPFPTPQTSSAILTADLSLRYLPAILTYLEQISVEDPLIPLLKTTLESWHYSGLLSTYKLNTPEFHNAYDDPCLLQLYVDRVIRQKKKTIGQTDKLKPYVLSTLGNYDTLFWKDFNSEL